MLRVLAVLAMPLLLARLSFGDEQTRGIACRSVHLGYSAAEGTVFCNEVLVEKSAPGTYFCVCGWSKGYFGIQEKADGKKVLIFSVWDPGAQNDPKSVQEDVRVKLLHQGADVRVGRFGNEGTGGQSFYDYDWKVGRTYRLLVKAAADGETRTAYAGYFFHPEKKEWIHLVTFSTIAKGALLKGYYSFVEDFQRNKISATQERKALFGDGWVLTKEDKWVPLDKARFTADSNPSTNINAGAVPSAFFLATGGTTTNTDTSLGKSMTRILTKKEPPTPLP